MIERNTDAWFVALDAHVEHHRDLMFVWGSNDCCTFAADWVATVRGVDPMADLRGLHTALAAARAISDAGGLLAAVTARMGPALPGTFAQVGDVALVRHGNDHVSMGVCVGPYVTAPGDAGLLMVPISQAEAAWRV